jgi:hypothetical protein
MLGRKTYTQEEIDQGKAAICQQLAAYKKLATAAAGPTDKKINPTLESFETPFFNNMTLVLDRYFVHRLSGADYEGKDGNPLNEVRVICDSFDEQRWHHAQRQADQADTGQVRAQIARWRSDQAAREGFRAPLISIFRRAGTPVPLS